MLKETGLRASLQELERKRNCYTFTMTTGAREQEELLYISDNDDTRLREQEQIRFLGKEGVQVGLF